MIVEGFGRLFNEGGEIVAEGSCRVDVEKGSVTLRPLIDTPLLSRQHGILRLELEDGSEFSLTDRVIRYRLNVPGQPAGAAYRLYVVGSEANRRAAGGEP